VTLLDGFAVALGADRAADPAPLPHAVQRLVAHLCLARTSSRPAIAGELWPDVPEDQASGCLRSALWRLQRAAPGLVDASNDGLCLAVGVSVDVRELAEWGRRALDPDADVDDVVVPRSALGGDLLPGWDDDWVLLERERLRQLRMHGLEKVAARLSRAGRHGDALEAALAAVRAEPLRESAHRTVVRAHLAAGHAREALRAYERFRVLIATELGVVPTQQMTRLVLVRDR
jgi:DNA-binding SARP family transcriptional activator